MKDEYLDAYSTVHDLTLNDKLRQFNLISSVETLFCIVDVQYAQ